MFCFGIREVDGHVKIDIRLHRDKKRLAQTKLASLPDDHPLREKYYLWIQELDDLIGVSDARLSERDFPGHNAVLQAKQKGVDDGDEVVAEQMNRTAIDIPVDNAVACYDKRPVHSSQVHPLNCSASVDERRKKLMAENKWLRGMLERYGNVNDGHEKAPHGVPKGTS